jgi:gliding motility-associated-like protein
MSKLFYILLFQCLSIIAGIAQVSITNPFEDHAFTKNEGQWIKEEKETKRTIYYGAAIQGKFVFITNKGLVYKYLDYFNKKKGIFEKWFESRKGKKEGEENEEDEEYYKNGEYKSRYVFVNYVDCNASTIAQAEGKTQSYTSYSNPNNITKTLKAYSYEKITLKNIYPRIDVEFIIKQSGGFEYNFVLNPFADVNLININYDGIDYAVLNEKNELTLNIDAHKTLIESEPISFIKNTSEALVSKRIITKNSQKFLLGNYDKSKAVVIDPVVFNPALTTYNSAYDIAKDNGGNILVFGGLCPYVLKKFSSTGVLLWSFDWSTQPTPPTLYGDFAVDQSDNVIMVQGYPAGRIIKTDPNGVILYNTIAGGVVAGANEFWRIAYNCDYSAIRLSGYINIGGTYKQIVNIDPSNGNVIASSPLASDESRALFVDPNGNIYSLTPTQGLTANSATNYFTKFDVALNSIYRVNSGYNTYEGQGIYQNVTYSPTYFFANMNGITTDNSNAYTFDGNTIFKRRQSNGALVGSIVVPNGITVGNSGIIMDPCFNLFVGTQNGVVMLDTNLAIINTIPTPAQVYDLCLYNGHILATGNGFVNELDFNTNCKLVISTNTVANTNCLAPFTGSASVSNIVNGIAPYTYLWSTGATTSSITALEPGKYWVTTKDAYCGNPKMSVDTVIIPNNLTIPTASFTVNSVCIGATSSYTDLSIPLAPSTSSVINWNWDFTNDGVFDNATQNPNHLFTIAGTYTTQLVVAAANSCTASVTGIVQVNGVTDLYIIQHNNLCDTSVLNWANWSSVTSGLASGPVSSSISVTGTHSNGGMSLESTMYNGGVFPPTYNVPIGATCIRNDLAGTFNFCFNTPVINPQIAFSSIGQAGLPVQINTSVPYQVVWTGINVTYPTSTSLIGTEGYTIIKFPGTHTCISLDYLTNESYCTITFGVMDADCQGTPICAGTPLELIANGAPSYTWNNGATTQTIIVTPTVNTTYTITSTQNGCVNSATTTVLVNPLPPVTVNSASICVGQQTTTLTANGALTYSWTAGLSAITGSVVTASPVITQNYSVTGTDINGCVKIATSTITVNPLPIIVPTSNTLCIGLSAPITASGATTYTWNPTATITSATGATVTASPSVTTNYTITATDANGCINTSSTSVIVNPLPILTVTSNTICVGASASLTASGATTYTWNNATTLNSPTGTSVTANPMTTTNYTVIGIDANGCVNTNTTNMIVNALPVVTTSPSFSMCSGNTGTLTVSGANTYTWNASTNLNSVTGSTVTSTANTTETYTVIGAGINTCTNSAVTTITVVTTPTISATTTSSTICPLSSATLAVSGATNYTWSPSASLSASSGTLVVATPVNTTTYNITGANSTCTHTAQVVVTVTVNPTIASTSATICSSTSANLSANGGVTYTWSPATNLNTTSGANVTSTPPSSITYTVSGSSPLGCIGATSVSVNVIPTPTITISANPLTVCSGSNSALIANGATSYTWSPSTVSNANSGNTIASPINTTTYLVTGTNGSAPTICTSTQTIQIVVRPKIIPIVSPNDAICFGYSTKIYAIGGNTYHWSPTTGVSKPNDSTTVVKPGSTTIYTVSVSINSLCPVTNTVQVTVYPLPIVNAGKDSTINIDQDIVLTGTGNVDVGFLSPDGNPLICNWCPIVTVAPKETTCYILEGFNTYGCRNTDEVCVIVKKEWDVFIPNAFTPNGDINNEYFVPKGYGLEQIDLIIFDRWGSVIFNETNTILGWDGKYKGILSAQGVYVYQATVKAMSGESVVKTGHVTVLSKVK